MKNSISPQKKEHRIQYALKHPNRQPKNPQTHAAACCAFSSCTDSPQTRQHAMQMWRHALHGRGSHRETDCASGEFCVEQHIQGRWVCDECETFEQEPMPAYVIDKGSATPGLLAQVLVNKYTDNLPHYRQEAIFSRGGLGISRSTLCRCGQGCAMLPCDPWPMPCEI